MGRPSSPAQRAMQRASSPLISSTSTESVEAAFGDTTPATLKISSSCTPKQE